MFSHSVSISVADSLRVITILGLSLDLGLALVILSIYFVANRHIGRVDTESAGTLTKHVYAISISYVILAVTDAVDIQGHYGDPLSWRTPLGFLAAIVGFYALVNMLLFQDSRLDRRDETVTLEGTPDS